MDYRSPAAENHGRKGRTDRATAVSLPGNYAAIVTKLPHPQGPGTWPMPKEIRLNAFDMNSVGHIQHGMWTHPRDQSSRYTDIEYWQNLARTAERGLFDAIFLADIIGAYDVYGGAPAGSIRGAVQNPINDPLPVVPVMAAVTKNIGFGVTSNATYESPYLFARRLS